MKFHCITNAAVPILKGLTVVSFFISLEYEHLLSDMDLVGPLGSSLSCLEGGGGLLTYVITTGTTVNKPNVMALFGTVALRERLINVHLPVESIPAILTISLLYSLYVSVGNMWWHSLICQQFILKYSQRIVEGFLEF